MIFVTIRFSDVVQALLANTYSINNITETAVLNRDVDMYSEVRY